MKLEEINRLFEASLIATPIQEIIETINKLRKNLKSFLERDGTKHCLQKAQTLGCPSDYQVAIVNAMEESINDHVDDLNIAYLFVVIKMINLTEK